MDWFYRQEIELGVLLLAVGAAAIWVLMRYAAKRLHGISRRLVGLGIPGQSPRKVGVLWALILVAILYVALLRLLPTLIGRPVWDGAIGVALGLFICAHPAANAINLLFFERAALQQVRSDGPLVRWLALNLLVLLVGWMVVFVGIRRLIERTI
ncbi:MAG: hypothetical protein JSV81_02615 [Anaerolineales bacterium]|nr:MAG: hypothetical protein JSV81_02615 [Anaerolineales bacterium]